VNSKVRSCSDEVAGAELTSKKQADAKRTIRTKEACQVFIGAAFYSFRPPRDKAGISVPGDP